MRKHNYITTPPGVTIIEQLNDRDMSQNEFAASMKMSENYISKLIRGNIQLTPDIAVKSELIFGVSAKFWNNIEEIY